LVALEGLKHFSIKDNIEIVRMVADIKVLGVFMNHSILECPIEIDLFCLITKIRGKIKIILIFSSFSLGVELAV